MPISLTGCIVMTIIYLFIVWLFGSAVAGTIRIRDEAERDGSGLIVAKYFLAPWFLVLLATMGLMGLVSIIWMWIAYLK